MSSNDLLKATHPQRSFVIAYTRVSTARQGRSGLGLAAQKQVITDFCAREGFAVGWSYGDVESGANDDRTGLAEAIEQHKASGAPIVVAKLDRLGRKVSSLSKLMEDVDIIVAELGIKVSPLMLHIYSAVAEAERNAISVRTKQALAQKKAQGWTPDIKHLGAARNTSKMRRTYKADLAALRCSHEYLGLLLDHADEREVTAHKLKMPIGEFAARMPWMTKHGTFKKTERIAQLKSKTTRGGEWSRVTFHKATLRTVEICKRSILLLPEDKVRLVEKYLLGLEGTTLSQGFQLAEGRDVLVNELRTAHTQVAIAIKSVKRLQEQREEILERSKK